MIYHNCVCLDNYCSYTLYWNIYLNHQFSDCLRVEINNPNRIITVLTYKLTGKFTNFNHPFITVIFVFVFSFFSSVHQQFVPQWPTCIPCCLIPMDEVLWHSSNCQCQYPQSSLYSDPQVFLAFYWNPISLSIHLLTIKTQNINND